VVNVNVTDTLSVPSTSGRSFFSSSLPPGGTIVSVGSFLISTIGVDDSLFFVVDKSFVIKTGLNGLKS
jgi:hypothetical protein